MSLNFPSQEKNKSWGQDNSDSTSFMIRIPYPADENGSQEASIDIQMEIDGTPTDEQIHIDMMPHRIPFIGFWLSDFSWFRRLHTIRGHILLIVSSIIIDFFLAESLKRLVARLLGQKEEGG